MHVLPLYTSIVSPRQQRSAKLVYEHSLVLSQLNYSYTNRNFLSQ
jgi:hypothetical protein